MFEPLSRFTNTNCTGQTHKLFLLEKPPFAHVKGTTKKADAFGLFVYPNSVVYLNFSVTPSYRRKDKQASGSLGVGVFFMLYLFGIETQ